MDHSLAPLPMLGSGEAAGIGNLPDFPDLGQDDWLTPTVDGADLADDDFLAALEGDDDLQDLFCERPPVRSSGGMRASFSMNDLTSLQSSAVPSWNHKLVSMKPKLEPVPEGGPATGGPLNLMPLTTAAGNGNDPHAMQLPPLSSSQPHNASEYVNLDSGGRGGLQGSLPSAGTLANQLQMTHVRSESQLAGLDGGGGSGRSIGLGAHPFQPDGMAGHGQQRWQQEAGPSIHMHQHVNGNMANGLYRPNGEFQAQQHGAEAGQGEQAGDMATGPPARRAPSGLPLRKSQSAVELGSWRSFSAGEELLDMMLAAGGEAGQASKLTPEERLARIQRYREKRSQRNFNRSIKYQCRKSLADTRPRVRGRFARSDDPASVLPHESKKAQREGRQGSGSNTDPSDTGPSISSDNTSSAGLASVHQGVHPALTTAGCRVSGQPGGSPQPGHHQHQHHGASFMGSQGATSPPNTALHHHAHQYGSMGRPGHTGGYSPSGPQAFYQGGSHTYPLQQQHTTEAHHPSMMSSSQAHAYQQGPGSSNPGAQKPPVGVSIIGASTAAAPAAGYGIAEPPAPPPGFPGSSTTGAHMMTAGASLRPPQSGPSVGGIFSPSTQHLGCTGMMGSHADPGVGGSSMMTYSHMAHSLPAFPPMSSTGQTIFSGANLQLSHMSNSTLANTQQLASGSTSAGQHPPASPPLSPLRSDSQSDSVGLSGALLISPLRGFP